mgnify:CR=1 FL=1
MPMAVRSRGEPVPGRRRALAIGVGWNLPWALFTGYALIVLALGDHAGWGCPIDRLIGRCPGCDLTRAYADVLSGHRPGNWLIVPVLIGFGINAGWSLARARRAWCQTGVSQPA